MEYTYKKLTDKETTSSVSDSDKVIVNVDGQLKQATVDDVIKSSTELSNIKKSVSDGKKKVAEAITGKGVTTATDATFDTMASNIDSIQLGSGDATAGDVLSGKTYSSDEGTELTGTMADKSGTTVETDTVTKDDNYTYFGVPSAGYYDTDSKVRTLNSNLIGAYYLGEGTSFDLKTLFPNDYSKFTSDNFIAQPVTMSGSGYGGMERNPQYEWTETGRKGVSYSMSGSLSKSYNNSTGILTCTLTCSGSGRKDSGGDNPYLVGNASASISNFKVYLIVGEIVSK